MITPSGIDVSGDAQLVTFLGTFSVGATYTLPNQGDDTIRVLILDRNRGPAGFHEIYDVKAGQGEFVAVTDGTTVIRVVGRKVEIDATNGTIKEITFKNTAPDMSLPPEAGGWNIVNRWNNYWRWSPYEPLAFARWAYDDSTLSKWYGVGFIWFLVRLALALLLSILDVILTVVFVIAGVFDVLFGQTGRNIILGAAALLLSAILLLGIVGWNVKAREL